MNDYTDMGRPWWYEWGDAYPEPEVPTVPNSIPPPAGVTLADLPDGRTVVKDEHAPAARRLTVLAPGWRSALADWRDDLDRQRPYTGSYYLAWWSSLAVAGVIEPLSAQETSRLAESAGRS